ncbi:MAG: hypothetical protein ACKPB0_03350 [Opitutaceae bacterium]
MQKFHGVDENVLSTNGSAGKAEPQRGTHSAQPRPGSCACGGQDLAAFLSSGRNRAPIDGALTTLGGEPGQSFIEERSLFDATAEYRLTRRLSLFASGTNLFNAGRITARESARLPHWARLQQASAFGANYTLGAKASF